jgi:hypothetical protein
MADTFSSTTSERLIFAGYIPLAFAGFIIIRRWATSIIRFWFFILVAFFVLALGPYLHIGGKIVALGDWQIPMPYLLLYHTIPFLNLTRSLSRYDLMVMLSLGVLVAAALTQLIISNEQLIKAEEKSALQSKASLPTESIWLRDALHTPPYAPERSLPASKGLMALDRTTHYALRIRHYILRFTPLLATLLICFEFLPTPYPISKIAIPQFYFDIGKQPEHYAIAELPMNWDRPTPLLHQTIHGKPLLTAYTSRDNPLELAWRTPVFQQWRYLGPDIIDQPLEQVAPTIFYDFNLRYIVLDYWQMPPGPEREKTEQWVTAALPAGLAPVYDDGRLKVYQTPPRQAVQPYLTLGNGWGSRREHEDGSVSRTIAARSECETELFLHHPQPQSLSLEITAAANDVSQPLGVAVDGRSIEGLQVTPTFSTYTVILPAFAADLIKLSLCVSPPEVITVRQISLKGTTR